MTKQKPDVYAAFYASMGKPRPVPVAATPPARAASYAEAMDRYTQMKCFEFFMHRSDATPAAPAKIPGYENMSLADQLAAGKHLT